MEASAYDKSPVLTKICNKCHIEKPLSEFYFRKNTGKYWNKCKQCERQDKKNYRDSNKSILKEQRTRYRNSYKEERKQYMINYYNVNKEKIKISQKEYNKTLNGRLKCKKSNHKRKAIKKQVLHEDWSAFEMYIRSLNKVVCYWCGSIISTGGINCHMDHIMPLEQKGDDIKNNIAPSCSSCNRSKHNRNPTVYLRWCFKMGLPIHPQFFDKNGSLTLPLYFEGGEAYDYKVKDYKS